MRRMTKIIAAIALCFAALTSCRHKELCLHHPHEAIVRVQFDWRDAPEADPEGMCVFFYPEDGGEPLRFDFNNLIGGEIEITVGRYNVICYNNDTEGVLFKGKNIFDVHEAYTRDGSIFESIYGNSYAPPPPVKESDEERVVITPDMMWGCSAIEVEITETGMSYICAPMMSKDNCTKVESEEFVIILYPAELTCIYTYEIRNVKNLKHATQMCATLSGMAGGINLSNLELYRECVTLPLESFNDKKSTIYGRFITFGHHDKNTLPHKMLLYVWMDDGQKYLFGSESERFDVTDQIHYAPNKRRVHIIIDGLDLPQPIENGHGFAPTVDDWDEVYEDIVM